MVCEIGRKLASRSHSEDDDQRFLLRLAACHKWSPPGINSGPVLFDIFMNDLDYMIESILTKSAINTKLGGEVNTSEGRDILQSDPDRLEEWASKSSMKFNEKKV